MLTKHLQFPNVWENCDIVIVHGRVLKHVFYLRGNHMISIPLEEGGKRQMAASVLASPRETSFLHTCSFASRSRHKEKRGVFIKHVNITLATEISNWKSHVYNNKYSMTGPEGNSEFCFPRVSMFPETKSRETLRFEGKKIHCSPRDQSLSDLLYSKTKRKQILNNALTFQKQRSTFRG